MALAVRGFQALNKTFKGAPKEVRTAIRNEYRTIADPTRLTAQSLAISRIDRIGFRWATMRVGVTQKLVYVAPRQRGVKTRGPDPRRRPKFADLLAERATNPALDLNREQVERDFEQMLDRLLDDWGES